MGLKRIAGTKRHVHPGLYKREVSHHHTAKQMVALGREAERKALTQAVRSWTEDRIFIDGNRTVVF